MKIAQANMLDDINQTLRGTADKLCANMVATEFENRDDSNLAWVFRVGEAQAQSEFAA